MHYANQGRYNMYNIIKSIYSCYYVKGQQEEQAGQVCNVHTVSQAMHYYYYNNTCGLQGVAALSSSHSYMISSSSTYSGLAVALHHLHHTCYRPGAAVSETSKLRHFNPAACLPAMLKAGHAAMLKARRLDTIYTYTTDTLPTH